MKLQLIPLMLLISLNLFAVETQAIKADASLYYEMKEFSNSKQKSAGVVYGVGASIRDKADGFSFAYEHGKTSTIRSARLTEDLAVDKIFTKYTHNFNDSLGVNLHYIQVLHDNIVPTNKSAAYGLGVSYAPMKAVHLSVTQYYADYQIFETYQSNLKIDYSSRFQALKYKITLIGMYIDIHKNPNKTTTQFEKQFIVNAKDNYTTVGAKLHFNYKSYRLGFGAFFGKRAFAIMSDGFKIQHHAMEFDRTYAVGIGKKMGDFMLSYQYVYQRAVEIPFKNENVEVSNNRIMLNYKF